MAPVIEPHAPATAGGRLREAVLGAAARVHSPLFWRLLYWLLGRRATIAAGVALLRSLERRGASYDAVLNRFSELLVTSGWPHHSRGWVNLDLSRFEWALRRRRVVRSRPPRRAVTAGRRIRLGYVSEFTWILNFSTHQFSGIGPDVELTIFDIEYRGRNAAHLVDAPGAYVPVPALRGPEREERLDELAAAIAAARLDLLLVTLAFGDAHALLDRVDVPCIVDIPTGSDVLHDERVGFHVVFQPQADYFVRDDRLFCGTSRSWTDGLAYRGFLVNDLRDIEPGAHRSWEQREPLLVFHGSLYKLASPTFLECAFTLLQEDEQLEFVFMGKDDGASLGVVTACAQRAGVAGRVHYDGAYSSLRRPDGRAPADEGWQQLLDHLERARLAPNPWPIGGGASIAEAWAMGVPTVHMALRTDAASWGRPQYTLYELEGLSVPATRMTTRQEYLDACRRCLYEPTFAAEVVGSQLETLARNTDPAAYWRQIIGFYRDWERRRGRYDRTRRRSAGADSH